MQDHKDSVEPLRARDAVRLRALASPTPIERIRRAFTLLDQTMQLDCVTGADPIFQQIHEDLEQALDLLANN